VQLRVEGLGGGPRNAADHVRRARDRRRRPSRGLLRLRSGSRASNPPPPHCRARLHARDMPLTPAMRSFVHRYATPCRVRLAAAAHGDAGASRRGVAILPLKLRALAPGQAGGSWASGAGGDERTPGGGCATAAVASCARPRAQLCRERRFSRYVGRTAREKYLSQASVLAKPFGTLRVLPKCSLMHILGDHN
jgi:hypothetical protein